MTAPAANFPPLSAAALTGRSDAHVVAVPEPACQLHPATATAMRQLRAAAAGHGIDLLPVSSFRSFEHQLRIWNEKFLGLRPLLSRSGAELDALSLDADSRIDAILLWSALPGASRHHWGSDFDVIDRAALPVGERVQLVPEEYASGGRYELLDRWLAEFAADYGFFRPYDIDRGGVQPEPWHLSFAPIAAASIQSLTIESLAEALASADMESVGRVLVRLPELHERFVVAVAAAPERALAAAALRAS
jgi:LAS superfamily LD-carboxypeptidase LdcB